MSKENILIINCGSSSLKFSVINPRDGDEKISGVAERLSTPEASVRWTFQGNKKMAEIPSANHFKVFSKLMDLLGETCLFDTIEGIGHRVVHGGETFKESCVITDDVIQGIEACIHLAPLHNPAHLIGIRTAIEYFPSLKQIAVFDTSFHQTMPEHAYIYAVPYEYYEEHGLRRYGMHGTSYRYVSAKAAEMLGLELSDSAILVAHLGNGASAAAVLNGESVDTTMGLTPLEGLVMGTRSGSLDPNVFSFLNKTYGYTLEEITDILHKQSGLLGISGLQNDCRVIEKAAAEGNRRAQLALDVFCYVLAKHLAGLFVALGRIDALVFTGGIGENSGLIRKKVLALMGVFDFYISDELNEKLRFGNEGVITSTDSTVAMVIATNEELMIAQDTAVLIS
ncbi:MAG: acetate kinase [Endozoicomonadaceae bacterium]|nr:acetate kinase [Endozoicomonadaceae bacterium]